MDAISFIAEQRITKALEDGVFDNLPGMGKALHLEDLSHLPPELRMAYTILKNSGYIEAAPAPGKAVSTRDLLAQSPEEGETYGKLQRLKVMMQRVKRTQDNKASPSEDGNALPDVENSPYAAQLIERL